MRVELGFQPNCSEIVLHISSLKKDELIKLLDRIGIREVEIEGWYSSIGNDEPHTMLEDDQNPSLPDFSHHAALKIVEDYCGCGTYQGGVCVVGHQHCQSQMFPTMKRIEDLVKAEGHDAHWQGDDGGNESDYEDWVEEGANVKKTEVDQTIIQEFVPGLTKTQLKPVIKYMEEVYGVTPKYVTSSPAQPRLEFRYDPNNIGPCLLPPSRFGGTHLNKWTQKVRLDLRKHIQKLYPKPERKTTRGTIID